MNRAWSNRAGVRIHNTMPEALRGITDSDGEERELPTGPARLRQLSQGSVMQQGSLAGSTGNRLSQSLPGTVLSRPCTEQGPSRPEMAVTGQRSLGEMSFSCRSHLSECEKTVHLSECEKTEKTDVEPDDVFGALLGEVASEHKKQLAQLHAENEELKQRLNTVLSATWKFTGDSWHADSHDPVIGDLQLLQTAGKVTSLKTGDSNSKALWNVSKEMQGEADMHVGRFRPRPAWTETPMEEAGSADLDLGMLSDAGFMHRMGTVSKVEGATDEGVGRFVMHPYSPRRIVWDFIGLALLTYDLITVPLGAFNPEYTTFLMVMDWFTLLFWTFDMPISLFTGYEAYEGLTVLDPRMVQRNYVRTRLPMDLAVIVPDWVFTVFLLMGSSPQEGDNLSKFIRAGRLIRIYRILRIQKLRRLWLSMKDRINSELVFYLPPLMQLVAVIMFLSHILCSLWYLIGSAGPVHRNWVEAYKIAEEPLEYRYFVSLQWAISRFTLTSAKVEPQNSGEYLYSICVSLAGTVAFFWAVGSITQAFILARSLDSEASKEFWLLRRYLRQHFVPPQLSFRVLNYAEVVCKPQVDLVPEEKVRVLSFLSEQLKCELQYQVSYSGLSHHPLLAQVVKEPHMVQGLVTMALKLRNLAARDSVFACSTIAKNMLMIINGEVKYKHRLSSVREAGLHQGDWLCEAVLWCPWAHRGDAATVEDAKLVVVDAAAFTEVALKDPVQFERLSSYAIHYCLRLNNASDEERDEIVTDVAMGDVGRSLVFDLLEVVDAGLKGKKVVAKKPTSLHVWREKHG